MQNLTETTESSFNSLLAENRPSFLRRTDLTPSLRLYIAYTALMANILSGWGTITELSRRFQISRTFVYMLASKLDVTSNAIFGANVINPSVNEYILPYHYMLSLRLEGRCSIESISSMMKRFNIDKSSVGSISQQLTYFGSLLPDTLSTNNNETKILIFLSDEIFSKAAPILLTVDPISSAILRIELADSRKAEDWKRHWKCLEENGIYASYLVCDDGTGLCSGQKKALPDVLRQSDTYHAIAHQFGHWADRLENSAYSAIQTEYDCIKKLDSVCSDSAIEKRFSAIEAAEKIATEAIELYENFRFLYNCLTSELLIFDKNGELRDRLHAEENIKTGLDLIETLGESKINEAVKKVRRTLPELLNYFDVAVEVVGRLNKLDIDQEALRALCLAWQWNKGEIKAKEVKRAHYCNDNKQFCLEFTEGILQENYEDVKEQVFSELDNIVQSSALVECINSIIRPYLNNSKNQISQEALNLIMFYHNHRRYNAGKRKGQTPMEILTGKKQEKDWIELLIDVVNQADPSFFPLSK